MLRGIGRRWIAVALVVLFLADVGAVYTFQTSQRVSEGDFFIRWYATREMVQHGRDPYSDSVTTDIQIVLAGGPLGPNAPDTLSFNYPLSTAVFFLPLINLDYAVAEALWSAVNQFALAGLVWVLLRLAGWRPKNIVYATLPYFFGYICYPFLYTIAYGQYTIVTLFFAAWGAFLLRHERYALGGAVAALALFKPQTGAVLLACLLFWCLLDWRRRGRGVIAGGAVSVALLALPLLWQPDWPIRWLAQVTQYRADFRLYATYFEATLHEAGLSWPTAQTVGTGAAALIVAGLLWLWWCARHDPARLPVLFALTAFDTLLVLPQWGYCNDILFYPAAYLVLCWLRPRLPQRAFTLLTLGAALATFLLPLYVLALFKAVLVVIGCLWLVAELRRPTRELHIQGEPA